MPLAIGVPPIEAIVRHAKLVPVFPCRRANEQIGDTLYKAKSPLTKHGLKDASQNEDQIRAWWRQYPDALVGVPTGSVTNLVVVDYDSHKAGESANAFITEHTDEWMATRSHQTLNGGRHYLFRPPAGVKYRSGANVVLGNLVRTGIDIRAEGGYIIWWPLHGAIATGRAAPLPAGLIDERRIEAHELPPLPKATPEAWTRDSQRVADALAYLEPQDYDQWILAGMAIHYATQGSDAGFDLWHTWSGGGLTGDLPHNYSGIEDCRYKWASFGSNTARPVTLGSLFAAAQSKGFSFQPLVANLPPMMETPPIEAYEAEANSERVTEPPAQEVTAKVRTPLNWLTLSGRRPPSRDWAVDHWLPMGHTALCAGKGGLGKTLLMQTMATCIATGLEYVDDVPKPRRVLFWAGEDEHDELWRRQIAICSWLGLSFDQLEGNLILESYFARDITLAEAGYGALAPTSMMTELRDQIGDYKADYVILDSTARVFGGNENDRHQVTTFVSWLAAAAMVNGAGLCLIGHPAKGEGSEYSGSTAWEGSVRSRLYLSAKLPTEPGQAAPVTDEDAPPDDARFLSRRKANYAAQDWRKLTYDEGVLKPDNVLRQQVRRMAVSPQFGQESVLRAVRTLSGMDIYGTSSNNGSLSLPKLAQQYGLLEGMSTGAFGMRMRELMKAGRLRSQPVGKYANRTARMGLIEVQPGEDDAHK